MISPHFGHMAQEPHHETLVPPLPNRVDIFADLPPVNTVDLSEVRYWAASLKLMSWFIRNYKYEKKKKNLISHKKYMNVRNLQTYYTTYYI